MNRVARSILVYAGLAVTACVLLGEVLFFAWFCIVAFKLKVTQANYSIPAIMLFLLAVGWLPLLFQRYMRRAFAFSLLIMTASFAITDAIMSMLIVTEVRRLKLSAIVAISWIAGGLWGWIIVYMDKHRWRIGERLGMMLHGHERMSDRRSRRPLVMVTGISLLAILVCATIWAVGREKLWSELWREGGYRNRLRVASNFTQFRWFIGEPEERVCKFLGPAEKSMDPVPDGGKLLWWPIGVAPPGATSPHAGQRAYLCVAIRDSRAIGAWIEYIDQTVAPADEKKGP